LRRVRDYEVLEEDGNLRPSSQAFIQGGPDANVSVYLASETTPEHTPLLLRRSTAHLNPE
jgi:hypothetical protein